MAAKKKTEKPAISPERVEEIRASARSGTNWASVVNYGPACECGHLHGNCKITAHRKEEQ